ncbi:MAG: endonuclease III [Candidatus Micrarchaeota archaeon]
MRGKINRVYKLLATPYGIPKHKKHDPLETLILTILSQNTSDTNRDRAYARLKTAFPTWGSLLSARTQKIQRAIRVGGLSKTKAQYIKSALKKIKRDNKKFSIGFLKEMSLDDARNYLTSITGVGPKTAAVVLCFSMNMAAFPVDTHIYRVSRRLGLIPKKTSREKAHILLEKATPTNIIYALHLLLIKHGRNTCKAQRPRCQQCPLIELCPHKPKTN